MPLAFPLVKIIFILQKKKQTNSGLDKPEVVFLSGMNSTGLSEFGGSTVIGAQTSAASGHKTTP